MLLLKPTDDTCSGWLPALTRLCHSIGTTLVATAAQAFFCSYLFMVPCCLRARHTALASTALPQQQGWLVCCCCPVARVKPKNLLSAVMRRRGAC